MIQQILIGWILIVFIRLGESTDGSLSEGYINLAANAKLDQKHVGNEACAVLTTNVMSSILLDEGVSITQGASSKLDAGNYSFIEFDKGCALTMGHGAAIEPNLQTGGGRIEVYCKSTWIVGDGTYFLMDPQSKVRVNNTFELGAADQVTLLAASTLDVGSPMTFGDRVHLFMDKNSRFTIYKDSKGVVDVSSSKTDTHSYTKLMFGPSARMDVSGSVIVGDGFNVEMTIGDSGRLIVSSTGQLQVEASDFQIGPSSYWQVDGAFKIDGPSIFHSGMQSNLTVHGTMETTNGNLVIAAFSSIVMDGYLNTDHGEFVTSEFSHIYVGPYDAKTQTGYVKAIEAGSIYVHKYGIASVYGFLSTSGGNIVVGERASVTITAHAQLLQSKDSRVELSDGSSLTVNSSVGVATEAGFYLQPQSGLIINGQLMLGQKSTINLGPQAAITFNSLSQFQNNGNITLGRGAILLTGGEASFYQDNLLLLGQQANVQFLGELTVSQAATVIIGPKSNVILPDSSILTFATNVRGAVGSRSDLIFAPKLQCTAIFNFNVGDRTTVHITKSGDVPGIVCAPNNA